MSTYMSGAYLVKVQDKDNTWRTLGQTEVGFEMVSRPSYLVIREDPTGRTPLDAIFTGVEDMIVRMEAIEWSANLWYYSIPWLHAAATTGIVGASTDQGRIIRAGQLLVAGSFAKGLQLTPITGPAFAAGAYTGKTLLFTKAFPLEPIRQVFSAQRLRTVPLGFYCFGVPTATYEAAMYSVSETAGN